MLSPSVRNTFSQRYSVWKTLGIEVVLLMLSVLPLTPGFSKGLLYTAIFYQPPFNIVMVLACCFLGLLFLVLLPLLWRAILGLPAIEVTGETVTIYGTSGRSVSKSSITHLEEPKLGNSTVRIAGGRNITLPVFLYKNSSESWEQIKALLSHG